MKERLSKHEKPKNSNNSSILPSQDENRLTRKSLRNKSSRKPGGQQGFKGTTLQLIDNPDKTEVLVLDYCQCCGNDLHDVTEKLCQDGKLSIFRQSSQYTPKTSIIAENVLVDMNKYRITHPM